MVVKTFRRLLAFALGCLGLSCGKLTESVNYYLPPDDSLPPPDTIVPLYGVPQAHYLVSGSVVRESDHSPLEGIELRLDGGIAVSDNTGGWYLDADLIGRCGMEGRPACSLLVVDTDGADGGGDFGLTWHALQLVQTEDGDGAWDMGTFEQHDITIELAEAQGR